MRTREEAMTDACNWLIQHGAKDRETAERLLECQGHPYFMALATELMQIDSMPEEP